MRGQRRKTRANWDTTLFHHTVDAKVLGHTLGSLALGFTSDGDRASEVRRSVRERNVPTEARPSG